MDLQAALELVSQLVADLPQHHADARRLKEMARRTQSVTHLKAWIDELVADYKIKIDRAARFRNGLTHGGAAVLEVAATIRLLVNRQARLTARTALEAVLEVNRSRTPSIRTRWMAGSGGGRSLPPWRLKPFRSKSKIRTGTVLRDAFCTSKLFRLRRDAARDP
jgi:hypothetical protein